MTQTQVSGLELLVNSYAEALKSQRGRTERTAQIYTNDLQPFVRFMTQEGIDPRNLDRGVLRRYLAWLSTEAKGRSGGYARVSVARKLVVLRSFYRYLLQQGHIASNPIPKGRSFNIKVEKRLPVFLGHEEVMRLVSAPDPASALGLRDQAILEMFYSSGIRLAELQEMDIDDLSLQSREVRVRGKGAKDRVCLLGAPAVTCISNYIAGGRPALQQAGMDRAGYRTTGALFLNRYGTRLSRRSIEKLVSKYASSVDTRPGVHPHTLRHTFATHLMEGGADLRVVQDLLGHSSPATTQVYTHVTRNEARAEYFTTHPGARMPARDDGPAKDDDE